MIPVRVRLPLAMLAELAEGPLDQAWVVLAGHHEPLRTLPDGRTLWGGIAAWDPVPAPPLPGQDKAMVMAERLGAASLDVEPDQWDWYPATDLDGDDDGQALELYAIVDDRLERMEVAIAPLNALLADVPEASREGR